MFWQLWQQRKDCRMHWLPLPTHRIQKQTYLADASCMQCPCIMFYVEHFTSNEWAFLCVKCWCLPRKVKANASYQLINKRQAAHQISQARMDHTDFAHYSKAHIWPVPRGHWHNLTQSLRLYQMWAHYKARALLQHSSKFAADTVAIACLPANSTTSPQLAGRQIWSAFSRCRVHMPKGSDSHHHNHR